MNTKANFGREIVAVELEACRTPDRLKSRKDRLAEILLTGFTLSEDDAIFEAVFDSAKADGWDFVATGPEGRQDRDHSKLSVIIDRCIAGQITEKTSAAYFEKPTHWLENNVFFSLQTQLAREGL